MDILWALLTLPYAPVRGLTAMVKMVAREAESRQYNPVNIRRELEELDRAAAAGDITPEERDRGQERVLDRLTPPAGDTGRTPSAGTAGTGRRPPARRRVDRPGDRHRGRGR
ncbi:MULTISPECIES: gas vesicle protein GvpG [Micromonospora]|uniref:Gas vesicle protein G n=1 Tax=Micromonospora solifontis TaxID=2487138 RepID=A0ABX9WG05_9ACTN|nr:MULTISPECIES: gas vesicle protein GvpG [Micromonospora]NES16734.1 gas vesicle protein G [Micromonospora sp. PPF5-17B]NES37698.1 gas vesicle protein G [Micromonospora solifontis]NES58436.1 gas vesicle protein G [Micromonospora sp. PPF5-6]RNL98045.1 gas vesicle protein G [Micromonospora solifontis]